MSRNLLNTIVVNIVIETREMECMHGMPVHVPCFIERLGYEGTAKPLCDACLSEAIRRVLGNKSAS
jgi:hypothetical protein